jgi:predicted nuclease with TOPRIM domain
MVTGFANRVVSWLPARHMNLLFRWALCSAERHEICLQKGFDMRTQLERRVTELESEYEAGQKMLADLETKKADLQTTLLRIGGAIQVLEELLAEEQEKEKAE